MSELTTKTLAQIVSSNHRTAAVFEKYHLDFCCKGKRSLQQACEENSVALTEVVSELETVYNSDPALINFEQLSLTDLADYIVKTHHSYVKNESPQLFAWLQKVASKHGGRHPEMLKVFELFAAVKEELELHMQKEEMVLFPRIKELQSLAKDPHVNFQVNPAFIAAPVNMMEQEHEHAGALLAEIRELTDNYTPPADACTTYRISFASLQAFETDLHNHVHLENNILFPKSLQLIRHLTELSAN